jgi:hypothetical protein
VLTTFSLDGHTAPRTTIFFFFPIFRWSRLSRLCQLSIAAKAGGGECITTWGNPPGVKSGVVMRDMYPRDLVAAYINEHLCLFELSPFWRETWT